MLILKKNTFLIFFCFILFILFSSCSSELSKRRAKEYCECLRQAKGEMTGVNECMKIIDSVKVEFKNKPRYWLKFQDHLDDCQN